MTARAHGDPVTAANLANLSVDKSNRLYWNGEQIRTRLQLNWWQAVVAILAAIASIATICTGLNNLTLLVCGRGAELPLIGCPLHATPVTPMPPTRLAP